MSQDFQQHRVVTASPLSHDMSVLTATFETSPSESDGMFVADTLVSGLPYLEADWEAKIGFRNTSMWPL